MVCPTHDPIETLSCLLVAMMDVMVFVVAPRTGADQVLVSHNEARPDSGVDIGLEVAPCASGCTLRSPPSWSSCS